MNYFYFLAALSLTACTQHKMIQERSSLFNDSTITNPERLTAIRAEVNRLIACEKLYVTPLLQEYDLSIAPRVAAITEQFKTVTRDCALIRSSECEERKKHVVIAYIFVTRDLVESRRKLSEAYRNWFDRLQSLLRILAEDELDRERFRFSLVYEQQFIFALSDLFEGIHRPVSENITRQELLDQLGRLLFERAQFRIEFDEEWKDLQLRKEKQFIHTFENTFP